MIRSTHWIRLAACAAAVSIGFASPALAKRTVKYFAWESPSTECTSDPSDPANSLPYEGKRADAWHDKLIDKGWKSGGYLVDGNINLDRFCDPDSSVSGCSDVSNGVDESDAIMFNGHGTDGGDHWEGLLRDSGSSGASCYANESNDFRVGDGDAEWLHLATCHSMNDENLPTTYKIAQDSVDSPSSGKRLHIATGFHGLSVSMYYTTTGAPADLERYEDFARDGMNRVNEAWLDQFYFAYEDDSGTEFENCPVTFSIGATGSACKRLLVYDGYRDSKSDPSDDAYYCYDFIEDCTPDGMDAFNPPED